MNLLFLCSLLVSIALGVGRSLDLALFTDAGTGLVIAGSVWLRYIGLAVASTVAVLVGSSTGARPDALCTRRAPLGVTAYLAAIFFALAGIARLALGLTGVPDVIRAVLEIACAVWMAALGRGWLRRGHWHRPTRSMIPAVAGGALFYWCVLARFMTNSASWHRVSPTAEIWQTLAALMFLTALMRALYLPGTSNGKGLCEGGLAAFALCLCWQLPEVVHGAATAGIADTLFGVGLCCVGALGALCAALSVSAEPRHSADFEEGTGN